MTILSTPAVLKVPTPAWVTKFEGFPHFKVGMVPYGAQVRRIGAGQVEVPALGQPDLVWRSRDNAGHFRSGTYIDGMPSIIEPNGSGTRSLDLVRVRGEKTSDGSAFVDPPLVYPAGYVMQAVTAFFAVKMTSTSVYGRLFGMGAGDDDQIEVVSRNDGAKSLGVSHDNAGTFGLADYDATASDVAIVMVVADYVDNVYRLAVNSPNPAHPKHAVTVQLGVNDTAVATDDLPGADDADNIAAGLPGLITHISLLSNLNGSGLGTEYGIGPVLVYDADYSLSDYDDLRTEIIEQYAAELAGGADATALVY